MTKTSSLASRPSHRGSNRLVTIKAKKARYFEDARFRERLFPPPTLTHPADPRADDWTSLPIPAPPERAKDAEAGDTDDEDPTDSERRLQPELNRVKPVEKKKPIENEFEVGLGDDIDEEAVQNRRMVRHVQTIARQISRDPNDGMDL